MTAASDKATALDIAGNRTAAKYPRRELLMRVLWAAATPLFKYSPRTMFAWRAWLLRRFGARIGRNVNIYASAVIYMPWNLQVGDWSAIGEWALIYNLGPVTLGDRVTISHCAHLCAGTHRYDDPALPLVRAPITIARQAWICSEAYVGPGVCVGEGAVVGARAVAVKDVGAWQVVAGNPARVVKQRILKI